jgi:hypothetical protein
MTKTITLAAGVASKTYNPTAKPLQKIKIQTGYRTKKSKS